MSSETLAADYFEQIYAAHPDPWNFTTSEYEAEKYTATLAALPREHYDSAFEIGCSIGVLTAQLASRCNSLLAIDVSEKALTAARARCENLPLVNLQKMSVPDEFPTDTFDLILVSEVGYYLSPADWERTIEKIFRHLALQGHAVLVHWTPKVEDYPQTGDEVHESFANLSAGKLQHLKGHRAEKYRIDVWEKL